MLDDSRAPFCAARQIQVALRLPTVQQSETVASYPQIYDLRHAASNLQARGIAIVSNGTHTSGVLDQFLNHCVHNSGLAGNPGAYSRILRS